MSELQTHYDLMWKESWENLKEGRLFKDPYLKSKEDKRIGITLRIRPNQEVLDTILAFQRELKKIEPSQYYYPIETVHWTVLSIISCSADVRTDQLKVLTEYEYVISEELRNIGSFEILLRGLTLSKVGPLIQGYPQSADLDRLRDGLRERFRKSDLMHSIDTRYAIRTAHSTVMRYQEDLVDQKAYMKFLSHHKNIDFGTAHINQFELVINDWYHRSDKTEIMRTFSL
ncbi:mutarotase [Reichenbachiella agarivorans]|uniref:Mutarotase n=1 Tax=Reichenbachiella agarivorans TaxID=2979464 RepID=A0ABY6CTJ6_9BACT|nr:mutarotase [Reichenbachiella agarivorans]UXP33842.1 mutarotase [Reichenbachiella agarivorans]